MRWGIHGWKDLSHDVTELVEQFRRENPDHNVHDWCEYKSGRNVIYSFSWPVKEMALQYRLRNGDICSIRRQTYGYLEPVTDHSRFTVIRDVTAGTTDPSVLQEIRGGRKKKFFLC